MKLQFDKNLEYQHQAIASIVDLFRGQTPMQTNFTVTPYNGQIGLYDSTNGIGNRLELDEDEILEKVKELAPESTRVVFKDNGFKTDSNKTNIKEILKCGGIEEFITL